jgi:hypothetical protein
MKLRKLTATVYLRHVFVIYFIFRSSGLRHDADSFLFTYVPDKFSVVTFRIMLEKKVERYLQVSIATHKTTRHQIP